MKAKVLKEGVAFTSEKKLGYFGWPSAALLKSGKVAVVASAYRLGHVCPFGKVAITYYDAQTDTFSGEKIIIDTSLDDRDAGICANGNEVLVTSFNNTREFQKNIIPHQLPENRGFVKEKIDSITDEQEKADFGSLIVKSTDGGYNFGAPYKCPVSAPHGMTLANNGEYLYAGIRHKILYDIKNTAVCILKSKNGKNWEILNELKFAHLSPLLVCEPHILELKSGRIVLTCRVQNGDNITGQKFAVCMSVSDDGGKTFSQLKEIVACGSPPHILQLNDGRVLISYGYRKEPYGVRAIISGDDCETFSGEIVISDNFNNLDCGYPCSVQLESGSIFTVYYFQDYKNKPGRNAQIGYKIWEIIK